MTVESGFNIQNTGRVLFVSVPVIFSYVNAIVFILCQEQLLIINVTNVTNSRIPHLILTGAVNANNIVCNTDYYTDAQMYKLMSERQNDEISVLYMNIRSIVFNFDEFTNYIAQFDVKPDIIALSETKITDKVNENPHVDIAGYNFIFSKSPTCFGGVGLYISVKIDYKVREDLDITKKQGCHCETLFIELNSNKKKKQVIGIVYRHPKSPTNPNYRKFTSEYEKVLLKLANERVFFISQGTLI